MADSNNKHPLNAAGKYYIDETCIDCGSCTNDAPENIQRDEATGRAYVFKQPTTEQEVADCEKAASECPVEAMGTDGE